MSNFSYMSCLKMLNIVVTMFGKGKCTHAGITESIAEDVPGQKPMLLAAQRKTDLSRDLGFA